MEKTLRKQLKALDIRPPLANNDINSILSLLSAHIKAKALTDEQITQIKHNAFMEWEKTQEYKDAILGGELPFIYLRDRMYDKAVAAAQLQAVLGELECR